MTEVDRRLETRPGVATGRSRRERRRKTPFALILPLLSNMLFVSCGDPGNLTGGAASQLELAVGYVSEGNVRRTERAEPVLNELRRALTTEQLVYTDVTGEIESGLAQRWFVSDDGLTVTLTLVRGVTFHDGAPLTAQIVKEFLDSVRVDPRRRFENPSLAAIEAVEAIGTDEVRLRYARNTYLSLEGLSIRIERSVNGELVGTGPFVVQEQSPDAMTLVANGTYHRGVPSIHVVHVRTYSTTRTAWVAMMRQEVDFLIEVPSRARDFVAANSDVQLFTENPLYAMVIDFNVSRDPFSDVRVRRALNHAVDRHAVIARALGGLGRPTGGVNPDHWAFRTGMRTYGFDLQLADQLLTDAGYPQADPSTSSVRDRGMSARLRFTCLIQANNPLHELIALIVQRHLFEVGVEMQLEAVPLERLLDRVSRQDYQAFLRPQNTSRNLSRLYSLWHSTQPFAAPGYSAADAALDALRAATSREEVEQRAREFQMILYEDPPVLYLVEGLRVRALSRRFVVPDEDDPADVWRMWQWGLRDATDLRHISSPE